jgi:hypothetical protein
MSKKTIKILLVLILASGGVLLISRFIGQTLPGAVRTESTVEPREGLVGYWNFDDQDVNGATVFDKSGNSYNGTNSGATTGQVGKIGQAFDFDGANADKVTVTDTNDLKLTDMTFSICLWLYPRSQGENNEGRIISKKDVSGTSWEIKVTTGDDTGLAWKVGVEQASDPNALTLNTWNHACAVATSASSLTFFINARARGTVDPDDVVSHTADMLIGGRYDGVRDFDGLIDEVRIYNRALSASEVTQLYNASKRAQIVNAPPREGLIGFWNLDDESISGTTVHDKSGQGNDGTMVGF